MHKTVKQANPSSIGILPGLPWYGYPWILRWHKTLYSSFTTVLYGCYI